MQEAFLAMPEVGPCSRDTTCQINWFFITLRSLDKEHQQGLCWWPRLNKSKPKTKHVH